MAFCISCSAWSRNVLCGACGGRLHHGGTMRCGELEVMCGLVHETVARRLVHALKYKAVDSAAVILGAIMADRLPSSANALVPVPRAVLRRLRYGVDPAFALARQIQTLTGLEVVPALSASVWWPSHAGADRGSRQPPGFRLDRAPPPGSILVDDVATTGATLRAAACLTGAAAAVTATRAETPRYE